MKNKLKFLCLILIFLCSTATSVSGSSIAASQQIIPADRRIDWSYSGIPGGIPERTIICETIDSAVYGNGATDATANIQAALRNCPDGQVVYLPAGTYLISSTILLDNFDTLRGAGPGLTILKHSGSDSGVMVAMRKLIYSEIVDQHKTHNIVEANKDSQVITLRDTAGINPGDILLLNQLNDGTNVDPVGSNGKCTFCGYEGGDRVLGQYVEVTSVAGNQVYPNVPLHWTYNTALDPWAYQVDAKAMIRHAGLEDLTLTEDSPDIAYMVEMQGAQYSWIKNVEVENVRNIGIYVIDSLQNEIRDCYVHTGIAGYGSGDGYGIVLTMYSSNNLVDDNILSNIDGGGVETHGGASGNVISYNFFHDIMLSDPRWLLASPMTNHGAHPKMNLWEGNIAYKVGADFIWGSSSHNTIFRSQSKGWWNEGATFANNAVELGKKNYYMNFVGNVLGTPGKSNRYEALPGQPYVQYQDNVIWALGINVGGSPTDPNVAPTLLRHGNFDYVTNSVVWDPTIPNHDLPASLYLNQKPNWWCQETPWPPIGPDVAGLVNDIPAKRRFEGLSCLQAEPPTPTPTLPPTEPSSTTVVNPSSMTVGDAASGYVSLDNVPAEGYTSVEFTCTYDPNRIEVSNPTTTDLFGADAVMAVNGPQNGTWIVAIAGSRGNKAVTSGVAFTFSIKALQAGQTAIGCKARISKGDQVLTELPSMSTSLTISEAMANGTFNAQDTTVLPASQTSTVPTVGPLVGDIDGNGVVDQFDVMTIGMNYNTTLPAAADLNHDGTINFLDLELLDPNYQK